MWHMITAKSYRPIALYHTFIAVCTFLSSEKYLEVGFPIYMAMNFTTSLNG